MNKQFWYNLGVALIIFITSLVCLVMVTIPNARTPVTEEKDATEEFHTIVLPEALTLELPPQDFFKEEETIIDNIEEPTTMEETTTIEEIIVEVYTEEPTYVFEPIVGTEVETETETEVEETLIEEHIDECDPYSIDDIYELAAYLYNLPAWQVDRALKLITYERYSSDSTLNYYMACTVLNRFTTYGYNIDIYDVWGGADSNYGDWMDCLSIDNASIEALRAALFNCDCHAWYIHGLVEENGYTHGVQVLQSAIYYTQIEGMYIGCWEIDAEWY